MDLKNCSRCSDCFTDQPKHQQVHSTHTSIHAAVAAAPWGSGNRPLTRSHISLMAPRRLRSRRWWPSLRFNGRGGVWGSGGAASSLTENDSGDCHSELSVLFFVNRGGVAIWKTALTAGANQKLAGSFSPTDASLGIKFYERFFKKSAFKGDCLPPAVLLPVSSGRHLSSHPTTMAQCQCWASTRAREQVQCRRTWSARLRVCVCVCAHVHFFFCNYSRDRLFASLFVFLLISLPFVCVCVLVVFFVTRLHRCVCVCARYDNVNYFGIVAFWFAPLAPLSSCACVDLFCVHVFKSVRVSSKGTDDRLASKDRKASGALGFCACVCVCVCVWVIRCGSRWQKAYGSLRAENSATERGANTHTHTSFEHILRKMNKTFTTERPENCTADTHTHKHTERYTPSFK